ncbi:hypothetical protein P3S67_023168 [Capsicum chacoense]
MSSPGRAGVVGVPHRWVKESLVSLYGLEKSSPRELTFEVDANRFHLNQRWSSSFESSKRHSTRRSYVHTNQVVLQK